MQASLYIWYGSDIAVSQNVPYIVQMRGEPSGRLRLQARPAWKFKVTLMSGRFKRKHESTSQKLWIRVKGKREGKHSQLLFHRRWPQRWNPQEHSGLVCVKSALHTYTQSTRVWGKTRRCSCTKLSEHTALMTSWPAGLRAGPRDVLRSNIYLKPLNSGSEQ